MDSNIITMTAPKPSFGMPVYGPALLESPRRGTTVSICATAPAVQAHVAGTADVRVKGAFLGDNAWRPPIC
jgi:hypothetical protein